MDRAQFWDIIGQSRQQAAAIDRKPLDDLLELHIVTLTAALREFPPDEVIAFDEHFAACLDLAYRWDIWGAAYWLHGGCSDDGFWDFRSSLISTGKENFERVLANPDDLAEIEGKPDIPYLGAEGFQYVASRVYEELTGEDMPYDTPSRPWPHEPVGERFDFDDMDEMARRYPKLAEKYPEMGDG